MGVAFFKEKSMSIFNYFFQCKNQQLLEKIMSSLSDFIAAQQAAQAKMSAAFDGLSADIKSLNDKIADLQASSGSLSAEDQASLDAIQAESSSLADKYADLDSANEPAEPVAPAEPSAPAANDASGS